MTVSSSLLTTALRRSLRYMYRSPKNVLMILLQALKKRSLVPLEAIRFLLEHALKSVDRITYWDLQARPPGLGVHVTLSIMDTSVSVHAVVSVAQIEWTPKQFRLQIRLDEVRIEAPPDSALSSMLGMVDVKKPGDLLAWLPTAIPGLVEGQSNTITFDLYQLTALQNNPKVLRALKSFAHMATITSIRMGRNMLVLQWKCALRQLPAALQAWRHPASLLMPAQTLAPANA